MRRFLLLVVLATALGAQAQEAVFETSWVRYAIATNGISLTLLEKATATNRLASEPRAFAAIKQAGKLVSATRLTRTGDRWRVEFGATGVQAEFRITARRRHVMMELVRLHGNGIEEVRLLQVPVTCKEHSGWWLGGYWNDQFSVCLFGLSDRVNVQTLGNGLLAASVYPEFGMEGQKVALVAAPTARFLDTVAEVERDCGLPSPRLDGQWAKTSRAIHTSYLFTDLTESNAAETIRYAQLGGFGYIMTYDGTWAKSLGSYPVNTNNFPHGEAGLKTVVEKCHAAGLKVGLHCLTSFVGKNDPLVRPKPDSRLLKDDAATLAADLDEKTTEITATGPLATFPTEGAFYGDTKAGFDIQIDDELIKYQSIDGAKLVRCTRGHAGTRPVAHQAGAKIHHLVERYGCYLADLRTTLKDDIADRLAGIVNRCGFDMIYFDGGECNLANGPYWYWVSQQQDAVCRRFKREVLVQGSGGTPWTWHWFARGCCDDFAAIAPKQYLDCHKIADSWKHYTDSFMPAELGWWGFLAAEPHQPATTPDEVEYYAVRMLALDTPVSLETHLSALQRNGRTDEMLKLLGDYQRLRVSPADRARLRTGEWHRVNNRFVPIRYDVRRIDVVGRAVPSPPSGGGAVGTPRPTNESDSAWLSITNTFTAQPLQFRLQVVPTLAAVGATNNITLLRTNTALSVAKPPMPGALASRTEFAKPLDLLHHRALAVTVRVDNLVTGAVLNVQLEAGSKRYRDHYLDLNFTGEKTLIIPEPTTGRMLPEFRPAHANYAFKAAMYDFNYRNVVALNLRWMRAPVPCRVELVEALAETDTRLVDPQIGDYRIPARLGTGDYIECRAGSPVRVFDGNGRLLASPNATGPLPQLGPGANRLRLGGAGPAAVKFTLITAGAPAE